jgi:hypothetical protein
MPIYEYVLLALLASGDHRADAVTLTLGPDAIIQPKGGGGMITLVSDVFPKGLGIKGESLDDKHKDEIEVLSRGNQNKIPLKTPPTLSPQNNMKMMSPQNNMKMK